MISQSVAFANALPLLKARWFLKSATPATRASLPDTRHSRVRAGPIWRASGIPEPERPAGSSDDDRLNRELRAKVEELFGNRKNVTIDMDTESGVQFVVQKAGAASESQQVKAAWTVIISTGVISIAAGILFTALYYTGAIHGSDPIDKRYEMPTYGSRSYIDPYQLLDDDTELLESTRQ